MALRVPPQVALQSFQALHFLRSGGEPGKGQPQRAGQNEEAGGLEAEEVAQAVAMVLGNSYMTGQTIVLNGGMAFI